MTMRVLVTGAAGFIGRAVVQALAEAGMSPVAHMRRATPVPGAAKQVVADLTDTDALTVALRGIEAVVHCAGALDDDAARQRHDGVLATQSVLAAMERAGVDRLVALSSMAVYDLARLPAGTLVDESAPLVDPGQAGPYVAAKLLVEQCVRKAALAHRVILRPGLVCGAERTWFHQLGAQISLPMMGSLWITLAGQGAMPVVHVGQLAIACRQALVCTDAHESVLNIVDQTPPTRQAYVRWLRAAATSRPLIIDVPWLALQVASALAQGTFGVVGRTPIALQPAHLHPRCKPLRYSAARASVTLRLPPRADVLTRLRDDLTR